MCDPNQLPNIVHHDIGRVAIYQLLVLNQFLVRVENRSRDFSEIMIGKRFSTLFLVEEADMELFPHELVQEVRSSTRRDPFCTQIGRAV